MSDRLTELPEGWEWVTFSDLIKKIKRGPSKKCNTEGRGIRYITSGNLQNGELRLDLDYKFLDDTGNIDVCRLKAEDLILNCVNSLERIGKSAVFEQHHGDAIVGFNNYALELRQDCICSSYANIYCQSELFQKQLYFLVKRAINQVSFATRELSLIKILLPPLNEQKQIVAKIEELRDRHQSAKQALEAIPELCDRFRQSVLAAAFRGDLTADWREENPDVEPASVLLEKIRRDRRCKWEEAELEKIKSKGKLPENHRWKDRYQEPTKVDPLDLPRIPDSWFWARAEEVCDFITKGTTPSSNEMFEQEGEVPFIKVYNLTFDGKLDFSINPTFINKSTHNGKLARSKVFPGDVLMNIVGPPLGKVSIVPNDMPEWNMNQAIVVYRPIKGVDNRFLCYYLLSKECLSFASSMAKATAGQFNLTLEICRDLPLPIPPILEQQQIVAQIDHFFNVANLISEKVKEGTVQTDRLNQSILAKAFRGELVEQDPNDEPASVLLERIRAEREKADNGNKTKGKRAKQLKLEV